MMFFYISHQLPLLAICII